MKIIDKEDRVHVHTDTLEWTILKQFHSGKGPCYISDVRELKSPWRQLLSDSFLNGHTINDPLNGGAFGFGFIAARPPDPPAPDTFWNWAWEVTTRLRGGGFGVANPKVRVEEEKVYATCMLNVLGLPDMVLTWAYSFHGDKAICELVASPFAPHYPLWIKEPKIVVNGLRDYKVLQVQDERGQLLGRTRPLDYYKDPRKSTMQIWHPHRYAYLLSGGTYSAKVTYDRALELWMDEANRQPAMSPNAIRIDGSYGPAAAYCLGPNGLKCQTEVPRWADRNVCGLSLHGWEGGYGAPDCWNTFRPWPTKTVKANLSLEFWRT